MSNKDDTPSLANGTSVVTAATAQWMSVHIFKWFRYEYLTSFAGGFYAMCLA